jgi:hypothetical protein
VLLVPSRKGRSARVQALVGFLQARHADIKR